MAGNLTIRNVRPLGNAPCTIYVKNGRYALEPPEDGPSIDATGQTLLPGLVDAHMHLDKTLWGLPWRPHSAGASLAEKIANERQVRKSLGADTHAQAVALIRQASQNGTTHIRTHVDVDPEIGLDNIHAVLRARDTCADLVNVQIVAFPQSGLVSQPGTAQLLENAIHKGADLIGGIDPQVIDGNAKEHIKTVFDIADRTGAGIDIHHHEEGEEGADTLAMILDAVAAWGFEGRVTLSHAFCIGMVNQARREELLSRIVSLDVSIMTHAPGYKAFPPIEDLLRFGVQACSGSDGVRDVWSPYGNADMLERAMLLGYRSNFRRDEDIEHAFEMCTAGGAAVLKIDDYGLDIGCVADGVILDSSCIAEAVVSRPPNRTVIKNGVIVQ